MQILHYASSASRPEPRPWSKLAILSIPFSIFAPFLAAVSVRLWPAPVSESGSNAVCALYLAASLGLGLFAFVHAVRRRLKGRWLALASILISTAMFFLAFAPYQGHRRTINSATTSRSSP